jgi:putative Holliday junction resolvase
MTQRGTGSPFAGSAIGLDAGSVRVGVAASDPTGTLASPLAVLPRVPADALWSRLRSECAERDAGVVVVGLPRRLDGSEGDAARDARALAERAGRELRLPVTLWDERMTTVLAERGMIAGGARRRERRRRVDAVAAALMLQSWLDAGRPR